MKSAASCVGIVLLLGACSTTLERDLSEGQADEVVVALSEHGIGATRRAQPGGDGFEVTIAEADVAAALGVLREEGVPRDPSPGMAETYAEASLVPTAGEERARASVALAADLAHSIETLPGVHDARVHVGLPDPSVIPMDDAAPLVTASVLVHTDGALDEAAIRALVAGAVPGLAPERVAVVRAPVPPSHAPVRPLVEVGPVSVAAGSAATLRALFATALALNVALALGIGVVLRRRR